MSLEPRVRPALAAAILLLAVLTGCVQVPTAGPIEKVEGQQEACQSCVNVEVAPPAAGDDQQQIVEAYLRATSNYQPNYSVARQFLTEAAAARWSPEDGVTIYRGSPVVSGKSVRLDGTLVGSLAPDRTYTAEDRPLQVDFHLVQEDGEWRIDQPPQGLMVAEYSFNRFYQPYQIYFIGNGSSLVPERIYLPTLRNPANVASALMTALLAGPSEWLKPAVESAIPAATSLSVDSVTITNSIAEVALSEAVLTLPDPLRSLMAAQIVFTLKQAPGVKGVLITVNQQRYRVLESDPTSLVIAVDAFSRDIDPVPVVSGDQLYAVRDGMVHLVTTTTDPPDVSVMDGPLGSERRFAVDSLAVSVNGTDLAAVTQDRTVLRRTPTATEDVTTLASGVSDLLRPQFTRYGEVWALGRQDGKQRMWLFTTDQEIKDTEQEIEVTKIDVVAPVLDGAEVTAFRISPDGSRIALVRQTRTGSELGLARIIRGDKTIVDGLRPIDVTQTGGTPVNRIADLAWLDASELLLLGAASEDAALAPVRVTADASRIIAEGGEPANWDAQQLTVLSRPQTTVVVGRDGRTWRDDGSQWSKLLDDIDAIAYPG